jgi:hypothetical protein
LPGQGQWFSVTYGDGAFVAVANSDTAAYSADGITWTATNMPDDVNWQSVTYGDDKFVAVAAGSQSDPLTTSAAYSTDGTTWTASTMPSSATWYSVTHGDGAFVAVANSDTAAYSTNGITWTTSTMPSSASWFSVTHGDGKFVAVVLGSTSAAYSTDGTTWTASTLPSSADWHSVTYGDETHESPFNVSKTLYTAPTSKQASISSISIINNGENSGEYYLGIVKSSDSSTPGISTTQQIIPTKTLAAGEIDEIVGGITLSAGDEIRIYSESPDITAHIYGVELS